MTYSVTLSKNWQITLPKQWINKFNIKKIFIEEERWWLFIKPIEKSINTDDRVDNLFEKEVNHDKNHPLHDNNVEIYDDWDWIRFKKWIEAWKLLKFMKKCV